MCKYVCVRACVRACVRVYKVKMVSIDVEFFTLIMQYIFTTKSSVCCAWFVEIKYMNYIFYN